MADVKKLAEELVNLKVTEVNELAQILKEEYGIEPAAAAVAVAAPAAGAGEAAAAEKTSFDVILKAAGQAKLQLQQLQLQHLQQAEQPLLRRRQSLTLFLLT